MANRVEVILDAVDNISGTVNSAVGSIKSAGQGLTQNVTLPILAAGAAIAKISGDFQAGMNQVKALTQC